MTTIKKSFGVRGVADYETLMRIQELISLAKGQYTFVGKAEIDTEKITYYKFGMKLGFHRHATNGLVTNEQGIIRYCGITAPELLDSQVLSDLCSLFGMSRQFHI
ncbi:MAG TPA: hypothetical protein DC009_00465 [Porphyromonadaceae bacterium]|nr:hypothetical protein [Porphyromonadaceae bacterium]